MRRGALETFAGQHVKVLAMDVDLVMAVSACRRAIGRREHNSIQIRHRDACAGRRTELISDVSPALAGWEVTTESFFQVLAKGKCEHYRLLVG